MDSVVHAEDSSSASVNFSVTIQKTKRASSGIYTIWPVEGPSFLVRMEYMRDLSEDLLVPGSILSPDESSSLLDAARLFLVERTAVGYLSRAEHSRFLLDVKLQKKGWVSSDTTVVLDYLESRSWLSDTRYADAWLRNRQIHKNEGRLKLIAGLRSRGISAEIAEKALKLHFSPDDEEITCKKAISKFQRQGREGKKLLSSLVRSGFSLKLISFCLRNYPNDEFKA